MPLFAEGAEIYLSPASAEQEVSSTFVLSVYASSPDQSMNAVSGTISFPYDKLNVVSLSKKDSIISFWVQEPSFFNKTGIISFEGVVLNPGFKG